MWLLWSDFHLPRITIFKRQEVAINGDMLHKYGLDNPTCNIWPRSGKQLY